MAVDQLICDGVSRLTPYQPGKPIETLERELGIRDIIKLASNENPLGASPRGSAAAARAVAEIHRYPDGAGFALRNRLASKFGVDAAQVTLGNGSNDLLDIIARTFLSPGYNSIFSEYAFAIYPIETQAVGAEAKVAKALPADHPQMPYGHDLAAMAERVDEKTRLVFIANPNNPTGTWLQRDELYAFLKSMPEHLLVVLDEAYTEYVDEEEFPNGIEWLAEFPNLIVTRTFSKIYGLAGLRCGYALSSAEVAEYLNRVRQPFNVNSIAMAAALAALDDDDFVEQSAALNRTGLVQLKEGFEAMGLCCIPSVGNFITVDFGREALPIFDGLLRRGVIVRPVGGYGMPNHLRISVGLESENERCLQALAEVLKG